MERQKMMVERGVIIVALTFAIVMSAFGERTGLTGSAGGYTWEFTLKDDNTAELCSCSPEQSGKLYIPETIVYPEQVLVDGELVTRERLVDVTSIDGTFTSHTDVKDVTIPEFIKYIGVSTFGCCPITNLVILGGCYVHGDAFPSCELESVSFSDNVVFSWGNYFNVANERLIDSTTIPGVTLLDGYVMPCHTNNVPIKWHLPSTLDLSQARGLAGFALSSYSIHEDTGEPDPVETIILPSNILNLPPEAFDGLPNLKTVDFGRNSKLKHIYQMAFCECPELKEINLPAGLETVDYMQVAFSGVERISLPASLQRLSLNAFRMCGNLTEIVFEGNAPELVYDNGNDRGEAWFTGLDDEDKTIFNNVNNSCVVYVPRGSSGWGTTIPGTWHGLRIEYSDSAPQPQTAWSGAETVDGITWRYVVSNGVAEVTASDVFGGMSSGSAIVGSPEGLLTVPATLGGCPVVSIGYAALNGEDLPNVTAIDLPDTVTMIAYSAFWGSKIQSIAMPDAVENICDVAFMNCPYLETVRFGSCVKDVSCMAFAMCTNLRYVVLNDGLKTLHDGAFQGCVNLSEIYVPASVTNIGGGVFYGIASTPQINFRGDLPNSIGDNAFPADAQIRVMHAYSQTWSDYLDSVGLTIAGYIDEEPCATHTVTFDLGEHGVRTGGGELVQTVADGESAIVPSVAIKQAEMGWWKFVGWDANIGSITSNLVANAVYEECVPDDAVLYIYNRWIEAENPEDVRKGLGWTLRPAPPSDWTCTNVVFQGKERLRDGWQDMPDGCITNYCRAVLQIESMVNGAPMTRTLVSRNVLFENVPADDADSRDWDKKLSASLPVWEIMGGEALLTVTNGQIACFEYVFYNSIYPGFTHHGMVSAIITDPDGKSDCIGIDMEGNIGFLWWTAPDKAGQYTLSYINETSGLIVATCRVDVVLGALPQLPGSATEAEIAAALDGVADERLGANITNATQYTAFRDWALSITNGSVTVQTVVDSSQAWLSFALGANGLVPEVLTSDDIKIESFKPAAADGDFAFEVSIADVGVGSGVTITDANRETVIDNIKKVLTVEGAATLAPNLFSSDNIEVTFDTPAEGRARFTATPATNVGNTFFMRVKVR